MSRLALALPQHEAGKVRILGLTSSERLAVASNVPTLVEQKVPIASYGWWGMCAAAGTPQPVIDKLNSVVTAAVGSPDYKSVMEKGGTDAPHSRVPRWRKTVEAAIPVCARHLDSHHEESGTEDDSDRQQDAG